MQDAIIGIKKLQKELKRVADAALQGKSFTVVRDSKPVFRIEPIARGTCGKKRKYNTLEDLLKAASFSDPDPYLSQKVDEIVYGSRG